MGTKKTPSRPVASGKPIDLEVVDEGRTPPVSMTPSTRLKLQLLAGLVIFAGLCVLFPRFLRFVELGARELRAVWWIVLLTGLGIWLTFFVGRKRR